MMAEPHTFAELMLMSRNHISIRVQDSELRSQCSLFRTLADGESAKIVCLFVVSFCGAVNFKLIKSCLFAILMGSV